jgi:hypothetical protein
MSHTTAGSLSKGIALLLMGIPLFWNNSAHASKKNRLPEVVVMRPTDLPPAAQVPGQAMYLRALNFSRYLYIEQDNGRRLAVFDVSSPARIKTVAEIELNAPRFDFLQAVNSDLVLVGIRDLHGSIKLGVLDLQHPKKPVLRVLGDTEFGLEPHETSAHMLAPEPGVEIGDIEQKISDKELGSCFVLSADGLWIIRHPAIEKVFEEREFESYAG